MISKNDTKMLRQYGEDKIDKKGVQYVYTLFTENENNPEFKQQLKEEFYKFIKDNADDEYNLSHLLDRIHHIIHKNESNYKLSLGRKIYRWYSVVAAVLLTQLIIAGGIWVISQKSETKAVVESQATYTLFAPFGSRISFDLPDGTEGWLNSGSTLKYNIPFSNNRNITVAGEAWFNVTHDENHPFEITAGNSLIKVLGTKFNLSAYPEEKYIEVVLEEGKVWFSAPELLSGIEMNPDERLILNNGKININVTDVSKYSAWKEGKMVFRGDPMDEVARRIERWYNVEVELVDKELKNYVFRGTFQDDSLEEVLHFLSMTSPIEYRIVDRQLQDNGTVQKKKILLYIKKEN